MSPETLIKERLESLRLSRARVLEQLEHASNPIRRDQLERALNTLNKQMEEIKRKEQLIAEEKELEAEA